MIWHSRQTHKRKGDTTVLIVKITISLRYLLFLFKQGFRAIICKKSAAQGFIIRYVVRRKMPRYPFTSGFHKALSYLIQRFQIILQKSDFSTGCTNKLHIWFRRRTIVKRRGGRCFFARQPSTLEKHCLQIFCKARDGNASLSMGVPRNQGKKSKAIGFSYCA